MMRMLRCQLNAQDMENWKYQIYLKSHEGPVDIFLVSTTPGDEEGRYLIQRQSTCVQELKGGGYAHESREIMNFIYVCALIVPI